MMEGGEAWEARVRERAYHLWLEEGRPEGRALAHWDMAVAMIRLEDGLPAGQSAKRDTGVTGSAAGKTASKAATKAVTKGDAGGGKKPKAALAKADAAGAKADAPAGKGNAPEAKPAAKPAARTRSGGKKG